MDRDTPPTELLSGAIDFDRLERTATGLRVQIYGPGFVPIRSKFRPGTFPDFMTHPFALDVDHGNVINVWCVRDEVDILASDEASRQAFAVLDHVITKYLLNR